MADQGRQARQGSRRSRRRAGQDVEYSPNALDRHLGEQRQQRRTARLLPAANVLGWIGDVTGAQFTAVSNAGADSDAMDLDPPLSPDWEEALTTWAAAGVDDPEEDRAQAAEIIRNWPEYVAQGGSGELQLFELGLRSLPDFLPQSVTQLDASENQLTRLPDLLSQNLTYLQVSNNQLAQLPEQMPPGLTYLNASGNQLLGLPESLPEDLEYLDAAANQLTRIPDILPAWVTELTINNNRLTRLPESLPQRLEELDVDDNVLTQLPENMPQSLAECHAGGNQLTQLPANLPQNLVGLFVSGNQLTQLPDTLPQGLNELYAANNRLARLPDTLPPGLTHIEVSNNELTSLPENILERLGGGCTIYLRGNPLSERVRNNLATAMNVPGYTGPRIFFSMDAQDQGPTPPLDEAAAAWIADDPEAATVWVGFAAEDGAPEYARFLHRLGRTVSASNPDFRQSVVTDLRDAATRPTLREKFFLRAFGATETCEDRVTLTWNAMQTDRLSDEVEQGSYDNRLEELMPHALRLSRLDALDRIARDKVKDLRFVDEIEVYLAFQNKLRQRLDLEAMVAPDMRFFDVSYVTDADLDAAEAKVRNEEAAQFAGYLAAQWEPWDKLLARIVPEAHEAMQEELIDAMDEPFRQRLEARLRDAQLTGDADAERTVGKEVRDELAREIKGRLTQQVLQERNLAHLIG